ncbi:TSUP family transporter [Peredibacter sp. HCB2-198]|uniref:TSUP family transporter n=1 Tax=Peredibacter sp. HCB2-198 TaxID=3383025 RepID=UPI0038B5F8AC
MDVYVLILILAVVQSLFGVGLLLFGTPIMLLMGYEYTEALMYLLPASAALSWSQVKDLHKEKLNGGYRKLFFLICLPLLFVGMLAATHLDVKWEIKLFVTIMLVVAFIIRTNSSFRESLQTLMKNHLPIALGAMGLIHGLSNMGGSILTPMVSSLYKDKTKVLAGVSFDYAFMASLQLIVLIFFKGETFEMKYLIGPAISLFIRYSIGKRVFAFTSETNYQRLLNGFILANAVLLGINL